MLLTSVIASLVIANSPLASTFQAVLNSHTGFYIGQLELIYPLISWVNDGLMAIFFFMAGLEIKREIVEGQLSEFQKASLPVFCAVGGMLVPAAIYFLLNYGTPTANGWGIPMATDIAFAVAILNAIRKIVPPALKVFLTALAIADDLGAIVVVAVFYTQSIEFTYLLYVLAVFGLLLVFNFFEVKSIWAYVIPGVVMWYFVHHSGIHATVAGVLTALAVPVRNKKGDEVAAHFEHKLHNPVNYIILPLFALANTNITFKAEMLHGLVSPLGLGIVAGLILGKPIGIIGMAYVAVKTRLGKLPQQVKWPHIAGMGLLAGIGFTMSIFISLLSFSNKLLQTEAKFAVLLASVLAALSGFLLLRSYSRRRI
ncbi:Na+/H+ antiporter NhaA [Mucilaginibacter terrae]|uniref:Na(+)/H(+) antiporter NhaA n=1 Tax=Mucilaginibacter terrae TaxID=1955052 RepID=A0ABU3GZ07_9SPHI|nr:Na+/H+ antiporter NhaA [Mucilaginibacter terrae]MDT3405004.1 NhaA family Na+:H+ antiporter [Mucilaginibacter terrae]